jgi:predicted RND superfamily exporter protein
MRSPWPTLAVVILCSLAALWHIGTLQVYVSPRSLTVEGDPDRDAYDRSVATFGSDNISVVFIQDDRLLSPAKLEAISSVVRSLETLPFVSHADSLFSVPNLRVVDELVTAEPFLAEIPRTEEEAEALRRSALGNPFVRHNLLSDDGRSMAINLHIDDRNRGPGFDRETTQAIDGALEPLRGVVSVVYQIGAPGVRTAVAERIRQDGNLIVAIAFGALILILLASLRRPSAAVIPALTAGLSVLWTLGAMAALGIPVSVMTAVVPVLLIVIGSTEDVHLLSEYYKGVDKGNGRTRAIRKMARRMGLAIGLTFLTSCLGFLAISANPVQILREFGVLAAVGLAINFAVTLMIVPLYLRHLGEQTPSDRDGPVWKAYRHFVERVTDLLLRFRPAILALVVTGLAVAAYGATELRVNNSLLDYFDETSEIRQRALTVHEELSGLETLSIVLDGHIDDTFTRVGYLKEIRKIQRYLADHPAFDSSISFADYVALLNSGVNDSGSPELPDEDEIVETLLLFVKHDDVKKYVSADFSQSSILVRHNLTGSHVLAETVAELRQFLDGNLDEDLDFLVTGRSILSSNAADHMAVGQIKSLGFMLVAIFLVISLLFINAKAGLIAVATNVAPVVVLFGFMGYARIPLDTGTTLVAVIALGVCVDHTMHFMVRYNQNLKRISDERTAIAATIFEEATPITTATLALATGLGTLMLSSFEPLVYFGLLSALVMLLAFAANFIITPILLSYIRLVTLWDMLSVSLRRELVTRCPLFAGMRPLAIRRIVLLGEVNRHEDGQAIMNHGQPSKELYVLLDGNVEIRTPTPQGTDEAIRVCSVGDVFGVAALMCGRPRVASARASGKAVVLRLNWTRLSRVARFYPRSGSRLFGNLATIVADRFTDKLSRDALPNCATWSRQRTAHPGGESETEAVYPEIASN